jgi:cyanate permease
MGTMMTVTTAFGVVGPIFVGWMFDVKESYRDPFLIISITLLAAIPLILTVRKPTQRRDRPAQS